MYIPLWLLLAGFTVVVCLVGVIIEREEEKRKLQERLEQLEGELEEKPKPANRLSPGEYETYRYPPEGP